MVTPFEATQSLPDGVREGMGNFAGGGDFLLNGENLRREE